MADIDYITQRDMLEINKRYEHRPSQIGGASSLFTNPQLLTGPRANLFANQLAQMIMLKNPEVPQIFTGHESVLGKYSDSIDYFEDKVKIINVIEKYDGNRYIYFILFYNLIKKEYDCMEIKHYKSLTEQFGYIKPITNLDMNISKGKVYNGGTIITHSNNHDEYGNYKFGVNLNTAFISIPGVQEDGKVISESASKKLSFDLIHEMNIFIRMNEILLNVYGNEHIYKCFPDIGEYSKDILLIKRQTTNHDGLYKLSAKELMRPTLNDETYYADGEIIDIEVYCNNPEKMYNNNCFEQLIKYHNIHKDYNTSIYHSLHKIITDKYCKKTNTLVNYFHKTKDYLNVKYTFSAKKELVDFVFMKIYVKNELSAKIGNKITGRSGEKGIITNVIPDHLMPIDKYGERVEMIESPYGTWGRCNSFQLYEQGINFISSHIVRVINTMSDMNDKLNFLIDYLSEINIKEANNLKYYYINLSMSDKIIFWGDIEKNGINVLMESYDNKDYLECLDKLFKKYEVFPTKLDFRKKSDTTQGYINIETENEILVGKKYFILLRQLPDETGFMAVNLGFVDSIGNPKKSTNNRMLSVAKNTPVKLSLLVSFNLLTKISSDIMFRFLNIHSNNLKIRKELALSLMLKDRYWRNNVSKKNNLEDNIAISQLKAYMYAIGIRY